MSLNVLRKERVVHGLAVLLLAIPLLVGCGEKVYSESEMELITAEYCNTKTNAGEIDYIHTAYSNGYANVWVQYVSGRICSKSFKVK